MVPFGFLRLSNSRPNSASSCAARAVMGAVRRCRRRQGAPRGCWLVGIRIGQSASAERAFAQEETV